MIAKGQIDPRLEIVEAKGNLWRVIYKFVKKSHEELSVGFFLHPNPKDFTGYILYKNGEAIGFATWNFLGENVENPVLRQIYIVPAERRKGCGGYLFTESRRLFSGSSNLVVESPNTASAGLLIKLGLVEETEDGCLRGKSNVTFVRCW